MNIFTSVSKRSAILLSLSIFSYSLIAQTNYYSIAAGAWNNSTSVWSTISQTGAACSCNPGTELGNSNKAYIYNSITATTLTTQSGSAKITVESGNTLTITTATFAMSGSAVIIVNTGGTLIFNANVTMAGGTSITNNGTVIVNGNITNSGSAVVTNNGTMDVYGNITTSGGASFAGTGTTYATGTVSGPGTSGISVLPAFFSSFTNASGTGLVGYSASPLAFNALPFNNNASTVLTGAGTFVPLPTQNISGTVNYVPLYTGSNSLGNSTISVVGGVEGTQYDTALGGMNFYSDGIIRLGGKYGYGISIQSNGDGIDLYDNSPITVNSLNGSLSLQSNANATLQATYGHSAIYGNDVIIQATGHADTGQHIYVLGSFPLAGNSDSILSRNTLTGRITEIAKSSLASPWQQNSANISYSSGNVGIGTNNPAQTLSVTGTLNYTDGNQGLNKVLASDDAGNATWKSLNSLQGNNNKAPVMTVNNVGGTANYIPYWADPANDLGNSSMYFDGQNYGINTTTPNSLFNIDLGIPNGDEVAGVPMFSVSYQLVSNVGNGNDPNVFTIDAAGNTQISGYATIANYNYVGTPPYMPYLGMLSVTSPPPSGGNSYYSALLVQPDQSSVYGEILGSADLNQIALGVKYTNPNSPLNGTDYLQLHTNGNLFDAGQVTIGNSLSTPDAQLNVSFNTNNATPPTYELAIVNTTSTPTDVFTVDKDGNLNTSGGYFINHQPLTINPWLQTNNVIYYGDGTTNYQVGIGTSTPDANVILDVYGIERATEIRVCPDQTCDFVFDQNYNLMSLDTLNAYLKNNHHLPGIASAKEMEAEGSISLGKMNMQLLQKVEELTLYTIQQKQEAKEQDEKIEKQDEKIKELEAKLDLILKQSQK